jgi:arabinofuranosyltransferase
MRRFIPFLLLISAIAVAYQLVMLVSVVDDAYISYRYLDNFLSGHGLVFNPGERVEGYTNFLWILLHVPFRSLGLAPETISHGLSIIGLFIVYLSVSRVVDGSFRTGAAGAAAALLLAGSVHMMQWTVSGLETMFFAALIAAGNTRLIVQKKPDTLSALLYGLAIIVRPDGVLLGGIALCIAWIIAYREYRSEQAPKPALLRPALAFFSIPLLHLVFRLFYYGYPLPNTFYAKLGGIPSLFYEGAVHLGTYIESGGVLLVVPAAAALFSWKTRSLTIAVLLGQTLLFASYIAFIGGDYFAFHRFVVPLIPGLVILAVIGLQEGLPRLMLPRARHLLTVAATLSVCQFFLATQSLDWSVLDANLETRAEREMVAQWISEHYPDSTLLALNAVGIIPYRTGMRTIDMLGLNDIHIARADRDPEMDGRAFVGHFKYDGDYVCSLKPDLAILSGASLVIARSREEAMQPTVFGTFASDRDFLRSPCGESYRRVTVELKKDKWLVLFERANGTDEEQVVRASDSLSNEDLFKQALDFMSKARYKDAIETFVLLLERDPGNSRALSNMAYCYYDINEFAVASELFQRAIRADNNNFEAIYGCGICLEHQGNFREAWIVWKDYVARAPENVWMERARNHLRSLKKYAD